MHLCVLLSIIIGKDRAKVNDKMPDFTPENAGKCVKIQILGKKKNRLLRIWQKEVIM